MEVKLMNAGGWKLNERRKSDSQDWRAFQECLLI